MTHPHSKLVFNMSDKRVVPLDQTRHANYVFKLKVTDTCGHSEVFGPFNLVVGPENMTFTDDGFSPSDSKLMAEMSVKTSQLKSQERRLSARTDCHSIDDAITDSGCQA
jgi:hypothetical protein